MYKLSLRTCDVIIYPKVLLALGERIDDVMLREGQFRAVVFSIQRRLISRPRDSLICLETSNDKDGEKSGPNNDISRRETSSEVLRAEVSARCRRRLV